MDFLNSKLHDLNLNFKIVDLQNTGSSSDVHTPLIVCLSNCDQYKMSKAVKVTDRFTTSKDKYLPSHQEKHKVQSVAREQLFLESKIQEQNSLDLGQNYGDIDLESQVGKSPMNSKQKKKQDLKSASLSQLIFQDTGYNHLFESTVQSYKLQQRYNQNLKQIKQQTEQLLNLVNLHLISLQSKQIGQKIEQLQKDIYQLRIERKNRSFENGHLRYGFSIDRRKKEILTRKFIPGNSKQNRSNVLTKCDSKTTIRSAAHITLVRQQKLMTSPDKKYLQSYVLILQKKRNAIRDSIVTMDRYYTEMIQKSKQENMAYRQQISLIEGPKVCQTPNRKDNFSPDYYIDNSQLEKNSSRGLSVARSPKSFSSYKKFDLSKLRSSFGVKLKSSPRQQYLLTER